MAEQSAVLRQSACADTPIDRIGKELRKRIASKDLLLERLLIGLLTGGHVLHEGSADLAGVALRTLADLIRATFGCITTSSGQLAGDVVGALVGDPGRGSGDARPGPIFANIVLADGIDRAPPGLHAALLGAMQEHQITLGGATFPLPEPFLLLATHEPSAGPRCRPLPLTQADRFMLSLRAERSDSDQEPEPALLRAGRTRSAPAAVAEPRDVMAARQELLGLHLDDRIEEYVVDLVQATREPARYGLERLASLVRPGASPRATIHLALAARGHAYLRHRERVEADDVKAVAPAVLRHRLGTTAKAKAEGISVEDVIACVIATVGVP